MNKKIAVIGGGTGLSALLNGFKNFPVDITAIITVSDDGSSTGKLRNEFNIPAVGDIRKVISNLSEINDEIKELIEYRFKTSSDLDGHALGNLILVAMLNITGNLKDSIAALAKLFDVRHTVLPLSEDYLTLMGETLDGDIIVGEENITRANQKYKRIFYKDEPHVLPEVIQSIMDADLVIMSMGSLYTSLLPNIVCKEIQQAVNDTDAKIMYVCNAMTQPGETDDFTVSDHLKVLTQYLGDNSVDVVVASNSDIDKETIEKYRRKEEKDPVVVDKEEVEKMGVELIVDDILMLEQEQGSIRHNSLKLGSIIFSYLMRN
ncbi:MAG: YvcK family protein [Bacilli bacterium]|nr:YvcK family protein [Bacilli bacterium]